MEQKTLIRSSVLLGIVAAVLIFTKPSVFSGGLPAPEDITAVVWKWGQTQYNNDKKIVPPDPSNYTIAFKGEGTLNIRADCNRAGGNYTVNDQSITIQVTHSTRAMCPPDSLEKTFLKDLNAASIFFFNDGNLYLDLKYDTGTMKFEQ